MLSEPIVQGLIDRSPIDNFAIDFTLGDKKNFACIAATRLLYTKKNGSKAVAKRNRIILYHLTLYETWKLYVFSKFYFISLLL